jgi:hypothetical protein
VRREGEVGVIEVFVLLLFLFIGVFFFAVPA